MIAASEFQINRSENCDKNILIQSLACRRGVKGNLTEDWFVIISGYYPTGLRNCIQVFTVVAKPYFVDGF